MNHLFNEQEKQFDYVDLNLAFEDESKNVITSKLELFLQEIYLALMIAPMEIWGIKDSIDLNQYLFSKYITESFIGAEIASYIGKHCAHSSEFTYDINAEIAPDNHGNDMVLISATIYNVDGSKILKQFVLGNEQSLIE